MAVATNGGRCGRTGRVSVVADALAKAAASNAGPRPRAMSQAHVRARLSVCTRNTDPAFQATMARWYTDSVAVFLVRVTDVELYS